MNNPKLAEFIPNVQGQPLPKLNLLDMNERIRQVLAQMDEKERRILTAAFINTDRQKICQEFGISTEYLRVLIHRFISNPR